MSLGYEFPMVTVGLHEGKSEIYGRVGYFKFGINFNTEMPSSEEIKDAVVQGPNNNVYRQNIARLAAEMEEYDAKELCAGYICAQPDKHKMSSLYGKDHLLPMRPGLHNFTVKPRFIFL